MDGVGTVANYEMKTPDPLDVPAEMVAGWQAMVDVVAEIADVPAALIMRVREPEIEVFVASAGTGNPYAVGQKEEVWGSGLYCETVIKTNRKLRVPDALADEKWKNNPDVKLNMIAYLGFPILMPDQTPFGTICVLDRRANRFSATVERLMRKFSAAIERDLQLLVLNRQLALDVARHKEDAEALRKSRWELAEAQRVAHVGSWTHELATDTIEWSDEMFRIFGLKPGRPPASFEELRPLLDADSFARVAAGVARCAATGAPYEEALTLRWPDGEIRHAIARGERVPGEPMRLRGTVADVTHLRRIEEALRARQDELERATEAAERANRAKGLFLANMSHEIRTPLSALVGLSQAMVRLGERRGLPEDFTRMLEQIRSGGRHLNLMLTNLLDLSATEGGKPRVHRRIVVLADWAQGVRDILQPIADSRQVVLRWPAEPLAGRTLRSDPLRLAQILINLVHNAVKFTPAGKAVDVRFERQPGRFAFEVADEGPGLPGEVEVTFEAFGRGVPAVADSDHGVGLGLYVVQTNAQLLGGRVTAENRPEGGARFRVEWDGVAETGERDASDHR